MEEINALYEWTTIMAAFHAAVAIAALLLLLFWNDYNDLHCLLLFVATLHFGGSRRMDDGTFVCFS